MVDFKPAKSGSGSKLYLVFNLEQQETCLLGDVERYIFVVIPTMRIATKKEIVHIFP